MVVIEGNARVIEKAGLPGDVIRAARGVVHRPLRAPVIPHVGHNIPQEAPREFADAVLSLI
jgi:pimeloyl-ACP methyl ester carboxylesterase